MADAAPAPTPAKTPKKKGTGKKAAKPSHPPYKNMMMTAIRGLKERNGSSRQAILKYILSHYKVGDEKKAGNRLRLALRKAVDAKLLKQVKGSGASGSFRIAKDDVSGGKAKKPKTKKKTTTKAKKPAAKKTTTKKAKKPKSPKKPAAKKAKKPAAAKKPKAAKKPAAKKAKRPAKKAKK